MAYKTETTRVHLKYPADDMPDGDSIESLLFAGLDLGGYLVRDVRTLPDGVQFECDELTLMVTRAPDVPGDVRILAFGPDDGTPGSVRAKARFQMAALAAREIAALSPPKRIEWRHRGGFYITEGGQIAVVTGMRGTSGLGARRKAAARVFSLYGPGSGRYRQQMRRALPFRIGGRDIRSKPEKLAQYAINTTICVLSLPFGAALMTYGLLGGGSLGHSARWVALTALTLSFVNAETAQQLSNLL